MKMILFWLVILTAWSWSISGRAHDARSDQPLEPTPPAQDDQGYPSDYPTQTATPAPASGDKPVVAPPPPPPIIVRVSGYGALQTPEDAASEPKRLKALRASKLDALRNMAERIYGTRVTGTSTVKDFVLSEDGFATQVDTIVRGARVVSVTENKGQGFETVLELELPGNFAECLTRVNQFRGGRDCFLPLPTLGQGVSGKRSQGDPTPMQSLYYLK